MSKEKTLAPHIKAAVGHFALACCPPHISLLIPFSRKGYLRAYFHTAQPSAPPPKSALCLLHAEGGPGRTFLYCPLCHEKG